jgi:hypothetical protein
MHDEGTLLSCGMHRVRLLEGLLRRLAVARDADAFALRGGMLMRSWAPERRARDVDLVCRLPYRPREVHGRLREILATPLDDGVVFEAERFRVDRVWPDSAEPGLKLFARGAVDGSIAEITADLTFQLDVWPAAARTAVATSTGTARLWTCPVEMVIGTKLGVIAELGPREWRAKDLADVWLALRRFPPASFGVLGEAIERAFARKQLDAAPAKLLAESWWREPRAAMRWASHGARAPAVPPRLDAVVAELRASLAPLGRHA